MTHILRCLTISAALCVGSHAQTPEFEVVSIKAAPPAGFFHASDTMTGGPGSSDKTTFRCSCTVGALVAKAFELQRYQIPGYAALPTGAFDISAKVPEGATQEQFLLMLQNLLKERFGLAWHFEKKELQGYELVVAKNGPKLKESTASSGSAAAENHGGHEGGGRGFAHAGLINFNGQARYRGDHQTMEELAVLVSNQITKPVDDRTGLTGKYDIVLSWSGDPTPHNHQEGAGGHAGGYGDHGGVGGAPSSPVADDAAGPTIFEALQSQLGLKLAATKKSMARMFVVDHIEKAPTAN
jgi:uncharacterized protein (TIGR03435 family)